VLTNERSTSASTVFAGLVHKHRRGVIVGRETGSAYHQVKALKFANLRLPNSQIDVNVPLVKIVFDTATSRIPHWRGVLPDFELPLSLEEMSFENGDMILDYAKELIERGEYLTDIETSSQNKRKWYIIFAIAFVSVICYLISVSRKRKINKTMKNFTFLLLISLACFSCKQSIKEPELVIIANNEIITMEQVLEYQEEDHIKAIHDGVSDEKRDQLIEIFGSKLPPKELIVYIELFSEEEKLTRDEIRHKVEDLIKRRNEVFAKSEERDGRLHPLRHLLNVNDTAKDFSVEMINGEITTLSELRGQVVLLYFWTTGCGPCIRQFHDFPSKIIEPFKNSAFVLLPISIGEPIERVKNKMAELKKSDIDFNVGIDPDRSIFSLYANAGVPHTFLIDKTGILRYAWVGGSPPDVMDNMVFMIERMLIASQIENLLEKWNLQQEVKK